MGRGQELWTASRGSGVTVPVSCERGRGRFSEGLFSRSRCDSFSRSPAPPHRGLSKGTSPSNPPAPQTPTANTFIASCPRLVNRYILLVLILEWALAARTCDIVLPRKRGQGSLVGGTQAPGKAGLSLETEKIHLKEAGERDVVLLTWRERERGPLLFGRFGLWVGVNAKGLSGWRACWRNPVYLLLTALLRVAQERDKKDVSRKQGSR